MPESNIIFWLIIGLFGTSVAALGFWTDRRHLRREVSELEDAISRQPVYGLEQAQALKNAIEQKFNRSELGLAIYVTKFVLRQIEVNDAAVFSATQSEFEFQKHMDWESSHIVELERDLAKATQANNEAQAEQKLLSGAFESLSDGVALFDSDDRLIFCNTMFRELNPELVPSIRLGMTFEEIAQRFACPLGSVKTWYYRGLLKLRTRVKDPTSCSGGSGR